jgi:hypothetical protein
VLLAVGGLRRADVAPNGRPLYQVGAPPMHLSRHPILRRDAVDRPPVRVIETFLKG